MEGQQAGKAHLPSGKALDEGGDPGQRVGRVGICSQLQCIPPGDLYPLNVTLLGRRVVGQQAGCRRERHYHRPVTYHPPSSLYTLRGWGILISPMREQRFQITCPGAPPVSGRVRSPSSGAFSTSWMPSRSSVGQTVCVCVCVCKSGDFQIFSCNFIKNHLE